MRHSVSPSSSCELAPSCLAMTQKVQMITSEKELRRLFWREHSHLPRRKIRNCTPGTGPCALCAWVDWIDAMRSYDMISEELAFRATL
jgi:hypothetical protein